MARDSSRLVEAEGFRGACTEKCFFSRVNCQNMSDDTVRHEMPLYKIDDIAPELPEHDNYWVAPNASLICRVRLLNNASIWFGAVLRGDNDWIVVGENSNVQDNSVIHTDPGQPVVIGANVTIGHKVILHSTTVGDNSLIGMGSTLLNRSVIGRN